MAVEWVGWNAAGSPSMDMKMNIKMTRLVRGVGMPLLFVAAYLGIAALWASASFDEAMAARPAVAANPLSAAQTAILLKVEDPAFFDHHGLSLADGQGRATISSALARELYLSGGWLGGREGMMQRFYRAVFDCCKKVDLGRDAMAMVLDAKLPKERQLAMYVDSVYLGTHRGMQVRGLPQGAQSYLGKPLSALTDHEFIGLVAMIKAPNRYHPVRDPAAHAERTARVGAMLAGHCKPGGWFDTSLDGCARVSSTLQP
jgi:membrane carboxypeptidase/penicillin-binding protein